MDPLRTAVSVRKLEESDDVSSYLSGNFLRLMSVPGKDSMSLHCLELRKKNRSESLREDAHPEPIVFDECPRPQVVVS